MSIEKQLKKLKLLLLLFQPKISNLIKYKNSIYMCTKKEMWRLFTRKYELLFIFIFINFLIKVLYNFHNWTLVDSRFKLLKLGIDEKQNSIWYIQFLAQIKITTVSNALKK